MFSNFRFYVNLTCCVLISLTCVMDLMLDLYYEAAFCAVVGVFTGFNAWFETRNRT